GAFVLPDQRRPSRRATDERPTARAVSHLAVLALLALTVAVGVQATSGGSSDGSSTRSAQRGFPFGLVAVAQGADGGSLAPKTVTYDLLPDPEASPDPLLERRGLAELPAYTPLPTPVAPPPPPAVPKPKAVYIKPAPIVGTGQLAWPVPGGTISQYYSSYHKALDIAAPAGSTVIASAAGVVTWSGWKNNGGGMVIAIDHGNGIITVYNHLGSLWVAAGATVAAGQGIAAVGCTGVCTGPHVHYEVIVDGVIVNPLRYL
ncbi:MAG: M23 family metallopeptidase, partial [Chloroflexota bacterium]